jgi:hypothetical protein
MRFIKVEMITTLIVLGYSWDFIIEVLPKMKADGLYNNSINRSFDS